MGKIIKKKKSHDSVMRIASLIFIFLMIIALSVSIYRIQKKRRLLQESISDKKSELEAMGYNKEEEIDEEYLLEKMAREQLLLKKPGEDVVFIHSLQEEAEEVQEEKKFKWWNPFSW